MILNLTKQKQDKKQNLCQEIIAWRFFKESLQGFRRRPLGIGWNKEIFGYQQAISYSINPKMIADSESRKLRDASESMISDIFKNLSNIWGESEIDLFTIRINSKFPKYASWKPFPPYSLILDMESDSETPEGIR